jgi:hypothetical protein
MKSGAVFSSVRKNSVQIEFNSGVREVAAPQHSAPMPQCSDQMTAPVK